MQDPFPCERPVLYVVNKIHHSQSEPVKAIHPGKHRKPGYNCRPPTTAGNSTEYNTLSETPESNFRKTLEIWWNLEYDRKKGSAGVLRDRDRRRSSPVLVTISKDEEKTIKSIFILKIFRASYKFLWCPVFKAASTNWMRNLVSLANLTDGEKLKLESRFKRFCLLPTHHQSVSLFSIQTTKRASSSSGSKNQPGNPGHNRERPFSNKNVNSSSSFQQVL